MPGQFIRTGKLPGAAFPRAFVRLLSCVCSPVCLQVRTFCVDFVAPFEVTSVDAPLPGVRGF